MAQESLADPYFETKEYDKSRECRTKVIRSMQEARINPSIVLRSNPALARIGVMLGERDMDLAPLRTIAEKVKIKLYEGWDCRYLGEILRECRADGWMEKCEKELAALS